MKVSEALRQRIGSDVDWQKELSRFSADIENSAARNNPTVFNAWKDRYCSPSGYESWNRVAACTCLTTSFEEIKAFCTDAAMFTCGVMGLLAQKLDPPAIYLKRDLVDSMLRTSIGGMEPPNTVFPAFFLMVPKGILTGDGDGGVSSLLVINESQYFNYLRPHLSEENLKAYYGHFHDEGDNEGVRVVACTENGVNYSSFSTWRGGTDWRNYENQPGAEPELLDFTSQLSQLAKNVILLMNHRYELLTTEQINPPRAKRGFGAAAHKTKPIYWLGKDFVSKKVQTTSNDSGESTGGTVTPHWRRGHWHTYRVGQNRASKTTRWLEPCKVNWS